MTTWALDLDGVLWTGSVPIPGSAAAVTALIAAGHEVVFVTNNSFATVVEQESKLQAMGIDAPGRFISSAMAGAMLVEPGERVFVLGGPGIREAVEDRGAHVVPAVAVEEAGSGAAAAVDAVLVGLDWDLSYHRLRFATQAIAAGARFVATNTDATYPTEHGFFPGAGSIVAAVAAATGCQPVIAGKPHEAQADLVRARFGADGVMVGDRPDTDGAFADALGYRFALVLSGVTSADDLPVVPNPVAVAADLGSLVSDNALGER